MAPVERPIVRLKSSASEREATMDSNSRLEGRLIFGRRIGEKMRLTEGKDRERGLETSL